MDFVRLGENYVENGTPSAMNFPQNKVRYCVHGLIEGEARLLTICWRVPCP